MYEYYTSKLFQETFMLTEWCGRKDKELKKDIQVFDMDGGHFKCISTSSN